MLAGVTENFRGAIGRTGDFVDQKLCIGGGTKDPPSDERKNVSSQLLQFRFLNSKGVSHSLLNKVSIFFDRLQMEERE